MVSEKKVGDTTVFLSYICGLGYADRETAQECEDYCRTHHGSCSAEISAKAVYTPGAPVLPKKKFNVCISNLAAFSPLNLNARMLTH